MWREAIDRINILPCVAAAAIICCSCSDGGKKQAQDLYQKASRMIDSGAYSSAIELLDSIDSTYPSQVDIRRSGMHIKAKAIEGKTLQDLQVNDSLLAVATASSDDFKSVVTFVTNPVEGYYVASSQKDVPVESTEGIHARISPDGLFYIISSAKAGTGSTGVELSAGGESARSALIQADGERNDRSMGSEIITFMQSECDTIGHFALNHAGDPITLTFVGGKNRSVQLPQAQAQALANVYAAAGVFRQLRLLQLQKSMLEKQLTISRSQQARTYTE